MSQQEITALRKDIAKHDQLYFGDEDPEIPDSEYDEKVRRLKALEAQFPEFADPESPTQKVGRGRQKLGLNAIRHRAPMLSLGNCFEEAACSRFYGTLLVDKNSIAHSVYVDLKYDGLSLNLTYANGQLVSGGTRGDGMVGEDVTHNVHEMLTVPKSLKGVSKGILEIRGEAVILKEDFERINAELLASGKKQFATPRNAASGTLRQFDPEVVAHRNLVFIPHGIGMNGKVVNFTYHDDMIQWFKHLGFYVPATRKVVRSYSELMEFYSSVEKKRDTFPFDIDGIVVSANSVAVQEILGTTTREPKWAVAFKFKDKTADTILEDIEWQVGRTGVVTPVAKLKPVKLDGVTISSATLHNVEKVQQLSIRKGAKIQVKRAGTVIPQVVKVYAETKNSKKALFVPPSQCPCCQRELQQIGADLRCPGGILCSDQLVGALEHMVSRSALNIEGLGQSNISQLVENGMVKSVTDLFHLTDKELVKLHRVGATLANKLVRQINEGRHTTLPRFIVALGIPEVGQETAAQLAKHFTSLKNIKNASVKKLMECKDVGETVATNIRTWFTNAYNKETLSVLTTPVAKGGCGIVWQEVDVKDQKQLPLTGVTYAITGTLAYYSREEAKAYLTALGAHVVTGISKNVDFVIAGDSAGSRLDTALSLGIPVWDEDEFRDLIKKHRK